MNPQMPQRGGAWPDCLGSLVILALVFGAGTFLGLLIHIGFA
jgi:hypothetical protein